MNAALLDSRKSAGMNLQEIIVSGFSDLKLLLTSKASIEADLATAKQTIGTLSTNLGAARAEFVVAQAQVVAHAATITAASDAAATHATDLAAKDAEIAALKAGAKSAGETAVNLVAAQGVPAGSLPATASAGGTAKKSVTEFRAEYNRLLSEGKAKEASEYWKANADLVFPKS